MVEALWILGIGIAGGIGAVIRSFITPWFGRLPWGVILVNTLAAMAIGYLFRSPDFLPEIGRLVVVGFAGGLSTFSGVAKAAYSYWHKGRILQTLLALASNVLVPLGGLWMVLNLGYPA